MFKIYQSAAELPEQWDEIVKTNLFLKKDRLAQLEILNPCEQRYHLNLSKKIAFVCYKLKLDLFTYSEAIALKIPTKIIGIPMSVSRPGYHAESKEALAHMAEYVQSLPGMYIILNSADDIPLPRGLTLPECVLEIKWTEMSEYFSLLRSGYRYRLKKAQRNFSGTEIEELQDNSSFDEEMYNLYEEVYQNSDAKLEKLKVDFFQGFTAKIFKFKLGVRAVAFVQLVENGDELIFLFGGFNHSLNRHYDLYINMLLQIIEYGTAKGFKTINFGQTSEETKLKLGAVQQPKYMYVYHSNSLLNFIIKRFIGSFSYKGYTVTHNVLKEQEGQEYGMCKNTAR